MSVLVKWTGDLFMGPGIEKEFFFPGDGARAGGYSEDKINRAVYNQAKMVIEDPGFRSDPDAQALANQVVSQYQTWGFIDGETIGEFFDALGAEEPWLILFGEEENGENL